jgi:hypothetical protein
LLVQPPTSPPGVVSSTIGTERVIAGLDPAIHSVASPLAEA